MEVVEELVAGYNDGFANECGEKASIAPEGLEVTESPTVIDTVALKEAVAPSARQRTALLVDMARAEALDALGDNRAAVAIVARHM